MRRNNVPEEFSSKLCPVEVQKILNRARHGTVVVGRGDCNATIEGFEVL